MGRLWLKRTRGQCRARNSRLAAPYCGNVHLSRVINGIAPDDECRGDPSIDSSLIKLCAIPASRAALYSESGIPSATLRR